MPAKSYANFQPKASTRGIAREMGAYLNGVTTDQCNIFFVFGYAELVQEIEEIIEAPEILEYIIYPYPEMLFDIVYDVASIFCQLLDFTTNDYDFVSTHSSGFDFSTWIGGTGWKGRIIGSNNSSSILLSFSSPQNITKVRFTFHYDNPAGGGALLTASNTCYNPDNPNTLPTTNLATNQLFNVVSNNGNFSGHTNTGDYFLETVFTGVPVTQIGLRCGGNPFSPFTAVIIITSVEITISSCP